LVENNLIDACENVTILIGKGFPVGMILIDFAKAFNKMCHWRLHIKLKAIGINLEITDWMSSFLSNGKQAIQLFKETGKYFFQMLLKLKGGASRHSPHPNFIQYLN